MINTKKSQNTKADDESFEIQKKAKAIIDGVFDPKINTAQVQKSVERALSGDAQQAILLMEKGDFELFHFLPEAMKRDSKVVLAAVKKYPHLYASLTPEMRNNELIKQEAIESGVKKGESIIYLIGLAESDKKTQKKMRKFLSGRLEQKEDYFSDTMSQMLYELYVKHPDLYNRVIVKGLLQSSLNGVAISSKLISFLTKQAKNLQAESSEEAQSILLQKIQVFLEIPNLEKYPLLFTLCQSIARGVNIVKITAQEDEQHENNLQEDDAEEDADTQEYYSYGPYNISETGNRSSVWDATGKSLVLDTSTLKSMSEISLENYMNFSIRMKEHGLRFLLDKHLHKIQIATGMSFFEGEGMSSARTLMFLNKIGKILGVPKAPYVDTDRDREVPCFRDIGAAYSSFRNIASSGNVGNQKFNPADRGSNSIVELSMKESGIINRNSGELSIVGFREGKPYETQKAA